MDIKERLSEQERTSQWDYILLERLAKEADRMDEWEAADGETFEALAHELLEAWEAQ